MFGISSSRVLTREGLRKATVLIKDGKITDVIESTTGSAAASGSATGPGSAASIPSDYSIQDVGDAGVMPGLVDSHVRAPRQPAA
jgi:imidazolonepropionase-like amidohydrolase